MRLLCWLFLLSLSVTVLARAQDPVPLPLRQVVLYKNGMGFFEHVGEVRGDDDVELVLPSSQLNDVLKSLTVLDLGGGTISEVTFDSTAPVERRLGERPLDLRGSLAALLNQMRGARVEVRSSEGVVRGRLTGAERRVRRSGTGDSIETVLLLVFTGENVLRSFELEDLRGLRLLEPSLAERLAHHLEILAVELQQNVRRLRISARGSGERELYVSYVSEAPIWKTTYRLVLNAREQPLLQGWAIVDNTTEMDWDGVRLSLVAGAPISFIQELSRPVYGRRAVVPPPAGTNVAPQAHEATLQPSTTRVAGTVTDEMGGTLPGAEVEFFGSDFNRTVVTDGNGRFSISVPSGEYAVQASLAGFGVEGYERVPIHGSDVNLDFTLRVAGVEETVTVTGTPAELSARARAARRGPGGFGEGALAEAPPPPPPSPSSVLRQQGTLAVETRDVGEQFEYRLPGAVSIPRGSSALLPIVGAELEAGKVTLWNESMGVPRRAVWLENTTGLTLDGGAISLLDEDAFAGEGILDPVQPGEKRLLSYALDSAIEVRASTQPGQSTVEWVRVLNGVVRFQKRVEETKRYEVRNNDDRARDVVIEHPVRPDWELASSAARPVESTKSYHRFEISVAAKGNGELAVEEYRPVREVYELRNTTADQVSLWLRQGIIDDELRQALSPVLEKQGELSQLQRQRQTLSNQQNEIFRDQERVRENLSKLGDSREESNLRKRHVANLELQEDRLEAIRGELARLDTEIRTASRELAERIADLELEWTP